MPAETTSNVAAIATSFFNVSKPKGASSDRCPLRMFFCVLQFAILYIVVMNPQYKLTGRPAQDGLAQVDYSGRRSGALQRASATEEARRTPTLGGSFNAAASQSGWSDRILSETGRACQGTCSNRTVVVQ